MHGFHSGELALANEAATQSLKRVAACNAAQLASPPEISETRARGRGRAADI